MKMNNKALDTEQRSEYQCIGDRRTAPRFNASSIPGFKSIALIGGPEVKLINISRRGALIEGRELMPLKSSISLRIVTAETVHIIKGRIIGRSIYYRCSPINVKELQCQSAIDFDEDLAILPAGPDKNLSLYM